jgi:homocysteine S-methyltransferase
MGHETQRRLDEFLDRGRTLILDGALATELEARGHDLSDALWSARLLMDDPEALRQIHRDYLDAGADVIISASYQATIEGFVSLRGVSEDEAATLLRRSVELALDARGDRDALVAASVGPYGASLADGSEYSGDYDLDQQGLYQWHRKRFGILAESGCDLLAIETIPSLAETHALLRLLDETPDISAWFSFSCKDGGRIWDGAAFASCLHAVGRHPRVVAVGVNCTAPGHVESLVATAREMTSQPIVAYPNSGEIWDAGARCWTGDRDPASFGQLALAWKGAGASLIGGCCRTGPSHIRELRALLGKAESDE